MSKYDTLINILDQIRLEAPLEFKSYRPNPDDLEKLNHARSKSLIHLFLKVSFGLLSFQERHRYFTDGSQDGGIDAYYIDQDNKKVYLIQSKFRNTSTNFETKTISLEELLKMDVERIIKGNVDDESGNEYSGKIKQLQRDLNDTPNIGKFTYEVILLANMDKPTASSLFRLVGPFPSQVFDYMCVYERLVFPVVSGTFYNQAELCISLDIDNVVSNSARINYNVVTSFSDCDITVVFVPTVEIGRILNKYRNSILTYNPRCFLELQANTVNKDIHDTICKNNSNEFALFNNGITMLSDKTSFSEHVGRKGKAQVVIENPQIINGGQTAFTLSRIYDEYVIGGKDTKIFNNKEVLLKIITIDSTSKSDEPSKLNLIEAISKATNSQSVVENADRRSNDKIQVQLQKHFFSKYGVYYERKRGEFADGIRDKYITRSQILDREHLLRLAFACNRLSSQARRSSSRVLFEEKEFEKVLNDEGRVDEYYYAYRFHQLLAELEKKQSSDAKDPFGVTSYGNCIRYGKYATVSVGVSLYFKDENSINDIEEHVGSILSRWVAFEEFATGLYDNSSYFRSIKVSETETVLENNYDGYYKGRTVNRDLDHFFGLTLSDIA